MVADYTEAGFAAHNRAAEHEFTVAVAACTRPAQVQGRQSPSTDWRGEHQVPPLAEELLAFKSCWGRRH